MTKHEFKQKCIDLRNQNFTLGEIVKILKRPKTTIYFHVKNIPISNILKKRIGAISIKNIENHRPAKGKSWKGKHSRSFNKWTYDLVTLISHFIFDGELNKNTSSYNNRSLILINYVKDKMKIIYDFEPKIYYKSGDVIRISYHNIEVTNLLKF